MVLEVLQRHSVKYKDPHKTQNSRGSMYKAQIEEEQAAVKVEYI